VRTIAILNQKGGVGKTTTVANLGAALVQRGRKICLIDLDPQAHLTLHFGIEPGAPEAGIYEVLTDGTPFAEAVVEPREDLLLCPSIIDLAAAEVELVSTVGREKILSGSLQAASLPSDTLLIDCPPSLGLLTLNALAAADDVFIPLQPHFLALQGLGKLLETVSLVHQRINPRLKVSGVILCMYETTTRLAGEVLADLEEFFASSRDRDVPWADAVIFNTVIRRNVKLAECPSHGETIFQYEPSSNGAADYNALADEVLTLLQGRNEPDASAGQAPDQVESEYQPQPGRPDPQTAAPNPDAEEPVPPSAEQGEPANQAESLPVHQPQAVPQRASDYRSGPASSPAED
jgi:chromosome partitioning protein